jgi:hypothetical protein
LERAAALIQEARQALANRLRFAFDSAHGYSNRVDASQFEVLLPQRVVLKCRAGAVPLPTVDFYGEALTLPVGVDLVAGDERIEGGTREVCGLYECDEEPLGS